MNSWIVEYLDSCIDLSYWSFHEQSTLPPSEKQYVADTGKSDLFTKWDRMAPKVSEPKCTETDRKKS